MACGNCVDKLARKLMGHHKIDMIRAYELAEKAVERVDNRGIQTPIVKSGNPTDYTKVCTQGTCKDSGIECTKAGLPCTKNTDCIGGSCQSTGSCGCPAPLANSHQVSGCTVTCGTSTGTCAKCVAPECAPTCKVTDCYVGTCGYDCDTGYTWNPVTSTCELAAVAHKFQGDGLTFVTT